MKERFLAAVRIGILSGLAAFLLGGCNHGRVCVQPTLDLTREPYGATDINAITGNQGLSVALNVAGTLTVFKWPNPSFYDQLKYMTTRRGEERLGALPNEGVFSGLAYETAAGPGFLWLRDLAHRQAYLGPRSAVVKTEFSADELGLSIEQLDFVAPDADVLWRHYRVTRSSGSVVTKARLVFYSNFSLQVSKLKYLPVTDWCLDPLNASSLRWSESDRALIQSRQGRDQATGRPSAIVVAVGLEAGAAVPLIGYDSSCPAHSRSTDPFYLAPRGRGQARESARGLVNSALTAELAFQSDGRAQASLLIAAGAGEDDARRILSASRAKGYERALGEVEQHWRELLAAVPLPAADDARLQEMALRSVIVLLLGVCRDSGAIVASMATQPPYGADWPRDGSYINEGLLAAGFNQIVLRHNRFYLQAQSRPGHLIRHVPAGNWAANYFADFIPGFPYIWWEIDETAYGIWTLFRYYEHTGDRDYLREAYPAIKLAADFLDGFMDPSGLPRPAFETDIPFRTQTLRGAVSAFLGLRFAVRAAEAMGDEPSRGQWQARLEKLRRALLENFYDASCRRFNLAPGRQGRCDEPGGGLEQATFLWPAADASDPMARAAAEDLFQWLQPTFTGVRARGSYDLYGLISVAKIWNQDPANLARLEAPLRWVAFSEATATGHLGEIWVRTPQGVYTGEGQPQLMQHALFYMLALEVFGTKAPGLEDQEFSGTTPRP